MEHAMGQRIRILIADDHPHSRKGLRALLSTYSAVEVVSEARDGREAVQLVEECQPDVVLMDIQMPVWDGLQATRQIKARWPQVRVIALTIRATSQTAAMSAGADGFLLKGCPSQELFAEIQRQGKPGPQAPKTQPESELSAQREGNYHQSRMKVAVSTS
jgi:DNA-binding NarL/FixJ family response regulator